MPSTKMYSHQIQYLNRYEGNRRDIILFAIRRFRNGEFKNKVIQSMDYNKNPLIVLPLRKTIEGISAEEIRMILQLHIENPVQTQAQIQAEELAKLEIEYEKYIQKGWNEIKKIAKHNNAVEAL